MSRTVGPIRLASWRHISKTGTRGWAISWVTQKLLVSFEIHFERWR